MAYVKISDPKIIDLSTIHQIVNVVNQHSDNITALTNNFGATYSGSAGTTSGQSTEYQYDISSQQIVYGKTKIDATNATTHTSGGLRFYTVPVTFIGQPFSAPPIVTLSVYTGSGTAVFQNVIARVNAVTTSTFDIWFRSVGNETDWLGSYNFAVDWIAIGPK